MPGPARPAVGTCVTCLSYSFIKRGDLSLGATHARECPAGLRAVIPGRSGPRPSAPAPPARPPSRAAPTGPGRQDGLTGTPGDTRGSDGLTGTQTLPRAAGVPAEGATSGKKSPAAGAHQCESHTNRGNNSWGRLKGVFEGKTQTAGFRVKDNQVCVLGVLTEPLSENSV